MGTRGTRRQPMTRQTETHPRAKLAGGWGPPCGFRGGKGHGRRVADERRTLGVGRLEPASLELVKLSPLEKRARHLSLSVFPNTLFSIRAYGWMDQPPIAFKRGCHAIDRCDEDPALSRSIPSGGRLRHPFRRDSTGRGTCRADGRARSCVLVGSAHASFPVRAAAPASGVHDGAAIDRTGRAARLCEPSAGRRAAGSPSRQRHDLTRLGRRSKSNPQPSRSRQIDPAEV